MRRTVLVLTLLGLAWVAYLAWPVYSLARLARAVDARDVATVMAQINVPALRKSLTAQVIDTYLKLSGKTASPLLRGVVGAAGIDNPIVAKMISPEALTDFLRTGRPTGVLSDAPSGVSGLTAANLGSGWQIFASADYGIRRFEIEVPQTLPYDRRFGLEFRLVSWRWQLVGVQMPHYLRVQLAEMLIKSQR